MVVTNMKELCAYAKAQRKIRADGHRRLVLHNGTCSGLTTTCKLVRILKWKSYLFGLYCLECQQNPAL